MKNKSKMTHPKTPTATAASRSARSWSISTRASGLMVAVFLGCRSFCTAETEADTFDVTSIAGVNCNYELITRSRVLPRARFSQCYRM